MISPVLGVHCHLILGVINHEGVVYVETPASGLSAHTVTTNYAALVVQAILKNNPMDPVTYISSRPGVQYQLGHKKLMKCPHLQSDSKILKLKNSYIQCYLLYEQNIDLKRKDNIDFFYN